MPYYFDGRDSPYHDDIEVVHEDASCPELDGARASPVSHQPDGAAVCATCTGDPITDASYTQLQKVASTVDGIPGSGLTHPEMKAALVDELGEDGFREALRALV